MFQNDVFEQWLDKKSSEIILALDERQLLPEEMMVLVLKAQSNHFEHLDTDLRKDMQNLDQSLRQEMIYLRQDMDKRFEQVDKRFEHVYSFMKWQTGIGFALLMGIYLKLFMG